MNKLIQPLAAGVVLGIIALFAVWSHEPLLAPSLGSALFTQIYSAAEPSASPYNIGVGQVVGVVGGLFGVFIAFAAPTPSFMGDHALVYARVVAVVIAAIVTALLQMILKAVSPTGGATALVVAIGAETADWEGGARLLVGIALVTLCGDIARRMVLRSQAKTAAA